MSVLIKSKQSYVTEVDFDSTVEVPRFAIGRPFVSKFGYCNVLALACYDRN